MNKRHADQRGDERGEPLTMYDKVTDACVP